jgi:hypothetical protein
MMGASAWVLPAAEEEGRIQEVPIIVNLGASFCDISNESLTSATSHLYQNSVKYP